MTTGLLVSSANHLLGRSSSQEATVRSAHKKAFSLIQERRLADHAMMVGIPTRRRTELFSLLLALHRSIYALDIYGEEHWWIQPQRLHELWAEISHVVRRLGVSEGDERVMLADLRAYQDLELKMRDGILPLKEPIIDTYFLKTADVRLARSIIKTWGIAPTTEVGWQFYDLLCEVCDDLTDLAEDATSYNFNRVALECSARGHQDACRVYEELVDEVVRLASESFDGRHCDHASALVLTWIRSKAADAKRLVRALAPSVAIPLLCNASPLCA